MGDPFPTDRVATVQAAPAFLDRDASVDLACQRIADAGQQGARLAAESLTFDAVGHYARPDIFTVTVDRTPKTHRPV